MVFFVVKSWTWWTGSNVTCSSKERNWAVFFSLKRVVVVGWFSGFTVFFCFIFNWNWLYIYGSGVIFFGMLRIVKVTTCRTTHRNECMKIACSDCIDQKEPHVIRSRTSVAYVHDTSTTWSANLYWIDYDLRIFEILFLLSDFLWWLSVLSSSLSKTGVQRCLRTIFQNKKTQRNQLSSICAWCLSNKYLAIMNANIFCYHSNVFSLSLLLQPTPS